MEQLTIAGKTFSLAPRYEEGHELTAGEASALNQTYFENVRNNCAKKVKDEGWDQDQITNYAEGYQFGVRTGGGGGGERDPVMSEATRIAKDIIRKKLKELGKKNVDPKAIVTAAKALVEKNPKITELAKQRVAEAQAAAADDLGDLVSDLPQKAPTAPQAEAAA